MKPYIITGSIFAILAFSAPAYAVSSNCVRIDKSEQSCSDSPDAGTTQEPGCSSGSLMGKGSACYYNCTSCKLGYTLVSKSSMGYTYKKCILSDCVSCASDTSWSTAGTGTEKRTYRDCDPCDGCIESTSYRCIADYYGSNGNCTPCPSSGTSATGSTAITSCYIPSGSRFSDSTGSGTYTDKCYYKN